MSVRIETLDRSGRWYLTPGSRSIYDLRVRNDATDAADCSIIIEDPASGVTVDPPAFKLRGHEVRTVTVLFSEKAQPTRGQRVVMKLRDDSGVELASFEHPLLIAGSTDCTVTLDFDSVIVEKDELKGFVVACGLRSQSEGAAAFELSVAPHPALAVTPLQPIQLGPGETSTVRIPIRWNATVKDDAGRHHPNAIEVVIPVSNGRRTCRLAWGEIEPKLAPAAWKTAAPASAKRAPAPAEPAAARPISTAPAARPPVVPVAARPAASLLMLSGTVALKCLPNPQSPLANGQVEKIVASTATRDAPAAAPNVAPAQPSAAPVTASEPTELTLFGNVTSPSAAQRPSAPPAPAVNGVSAAAAPAPGVVPAPSATTPAAAAQPTAVPPTAPPVPASAATPIAPTGSKLTPYAPTRWEAIDHMASAVVVAPPKAAKPAQPAQAAQEPQPSSVPSLPIGPVVRVRPRTSLAKRGVPAGIAIGIVAVGTLVAAAMLFKPNNSNAHHPASSVALSPPGPHTITGPVQHVAVPIQHVAVVAHVAPKPAVKAVVQVTATRPPTAAPAIAHTPAPTLAPAKPKPAAAVPVHKAPSWSAPVPRPQPAQAVSQSVVALGGIEAYYGPRGHAVRVLWAADEQAWATVQLINERGRIVSATTVRGSRQQALLYLPRRFHGPLTIQVSSVGRLGERVAQTASLPAFGE